MSGGGDLEKWRGHAWRASQIERDAQAFADALASVAPAVQPPPRRMRCRKCGYAWELKTPKPSRQCPVCWSSRIELCDNGAETPKEGENAGNAEI